MKPIRMASVALLLMLGIAVSYNARSPQSFLQQLVVGNRSTLLESRHYELVPESATEDGRFRVLNGKQEVFVSLCGITAGMNKNIAGHKRRDALQSMLGRGDGHVVLVPVSFSDDGHIEAEAFISLSGGRRELHLNSQLLSRGMAVVDSQSVKNCPNQSALLRAKAEAKRVSNGIWAQSAVSGAAFE